MGEIYANASKVVVWLGATDDRWDGMYARLFGQEDSATKWFRRNVAERKLAKAWAEDYPVGHNTSRTRVHMMKRVFRFGFSVFKTKSIGYSSTLGAVNSP